MWSPLSQKTIQNLRQIVLSRDNWQCVLCYREPVQIHEINPRSEAGFRSKQTFRLFNMVCLCPNCHTRWHNEGDFRDTALDNIKQYLRQV